MVNITECRNMTFFEIQHGGGRHTVKKTSPYLRNLLCYLAVLDPRVGHTIDVLSPFISVLCLFHGGPVQRPRNVVVHPGLAWSSSLAYTLHYLFPLFPHGVTIVC